MPDPSVLSSQVPGTAWQNPQAAPMYPGSGPAYQTQVPGGQMPSWDPTQQSFRPSYGSGGGAYPVQTGAVPSMPAYPPAGAAASSQPGAQPNVRPGGASHPGPHYYG